MQDLALTLRGTAAVTSHCRHQEWLCLELLAVINNRLNDHRVVGDLAAPAGDSYRVIRLYLAPKAELRQFGLYRSRNVVNRGTMRLLR
jgi:hypothetical protein